MWLFTYSVIGVTNVVKGAGSWQKKIRFEHPSKIYCRQLIDYHIISPLTNSTFVKILEAYGYFSREMKMRSDEVNQIKLIERETSFKSDFEM